ncbi:hypothetical protein D0T53_04540 [Dysgonomonas sp. 216]|uniref:lipopolysaccharide kinase InaA family protein n=1 Tax=Dysgonomonas sp. 216 TaxID=2302934 RepID=UPI0013D3DA32|nr:lipopolysaccharide kinase InaA family protein [Dysgonomonas sp. 216]NDW18186.1 hypothetical protein [Dysgonomonas sp. 216]
MGKIRIEINPEYKTNNAVLQFVDGLPVSFVNGGVVLYDKRNVIKRFELDANNDVLKETIVKRYKKPNIVQRISYSFFRESKAKRAFNNATKLRNNGINTPVEIAYVEHWQCGLFCYGYYISGSDNALPIRERLVGLKDFDKVMAADFAAFAANLHEKGILHHDLNSTNVLYHPVNNGHYEFSVIDINRMDFWQEETIPKEICFDNLTRFTGRMDLYEYVLRQYVKVRAWDQSLVKEAVDIKMRHDEQWRKRKAFLRKLKFWKKKK